MMEEIVETLNKELNSIGEISLDITIPFTIRYYWGYMKIMKDEIALDVDDLLIYRDINEFPERYRDMLKIIKSDILIWYQTYICEGKYYL